MPEDRKKRRRKLKDIPVDVSKVNAVMNHFEALQVELHEVPETEQDLKNALEIIRKLEDVVNGAIKRKVTFSAITLEDLRKAGIARKRIMPNFKLIEEVAKELPTTNMQDLHSRIKKIYKHVNMDHEAGSRVILDAILLELAEIASDKKMHVDIIPEMRVHGPADGIQITNPSTGYELWLGGVVDYVLVKFGDLERNIESVIGPGGSRMDTFDIPNIHLFLLEAKRQDSYLIDNIPEAVSQAVALLKSKNLSEVRFCLSDGVKWMFFILKMVDNKLTFYESPTHNLSKDVTHVKSSDSQLREIVLLAREWLRPTRDDLFWLD